VNALTVL
jgi:SET domain-containing protein 6